MESCFFNEDGTLRINELIAQQPSFQKIMEDGIVTAEEVMQQSELVLSLIHKVDDTFSEDQKQLVQQLLIETNVLSSIYNHYEMNRQIQQVAP